MRSRVRGEGSQPDRRRIPRGRHRLPLLERSLRARRHQLEL